MQPSASSPIAPMLAKAVPAVPEPDSVAGGLSYEPKWDGFRALIYAADAGDGTRRRRRDRQPRLEDADPVLPRARGGVPPRSCPAPASSTARSWCPTGEPGRQRLDWEALSQRIHPAASRVKLLAEQTPATFVAFDLLALGDESYVERPFAERRAALEEFAGRPARHRSS